MNHKTLFFFIILLCSAFVLQGQKLSIDNSTTMYKDQKYPSLKIVLEPDSKDVKKAYKKWMEDQQDVDVGGLGFLKNKDVLTIEAQSVKRISPNKMDLYAKFDEEKGNTTLHIFGAFGYDFPLAPDTYPVAYRNMKQITYAFLNDYLPGYYQEKIEDTKDGISDLKDDKTEAIDDIADNKEEIKKLKKENADLTAQIKRYEKDLKKKNQQLDSQIKDEKKVKKIIKSEEN